MTRTNVGDLALPGSCYLWSECRVSVADDGSLLAHAESQAGWECSSHLVTSGRCVSTLVICLQAALSCSHSIWEAGLNRERGLLHLEPLKPGQGWPCVSFDPHLGCHWLWLVPLKEPSWKKFTEYLLIRSSAAFFLPAGNLQYASSLSYTVPSLPSSPISFLSLPLP